MAKERTLHSFAARLGWLVEAWLSSVTKPLFLERWARNRTHTPHPFRVIGLRVTDFHRAVNQAAGSRYQWEKKVIVLLSGCIYFDLQMQRPNWKLKMWFFILFKKYGCSQKPHFWQQISFYCSLYMPVSEGPDCLSSGAQFGAVFKHTLSQLFSVFLIYWKSSKDQLAPHFGSFELHRSSQAFEKRAAGYFPELIRRAVSWRWRASFLSVRWMPLEPCA